MQKDGWKVTFYEDKCVMERDGQMIVFHLNSDGLYVVKLKFDGNPIVPSESINNVELIKNGPKETGWHDVASEIVSNLNKEGFAIKY
jgi:hypothetical protein